MEEKSINEKKKNYSLSVAIDGSSASGKTTGAKIISKHFGFKLLSSGKLYRYIALRMIRDKKKNLIKITLKKLQKILTLKN